MVTLQNRVALYVPSTLKGSEPLPEYYHRLYVERVARGLAIACGGVTIHKVEGWYISDNHEFIKEPITLVEAYHTDSRSAIAEKTLYDLADRLKRELEQESISICINDKMILV